MNQIKKIIITGPPGTGKTSIITHLKNLGYFCFDEIWKENYKNPTKEHNSNEIENFSKYLFKKRKEQFEFKITSKSTIKNMVFYDRSLIDVVSYLITYKKQTPVNWIEYIKEKKYYKNIFYCPLWNNIYENNSRRKEKYQDTIKIDEDMRHLYKKLGYNIKELDKKNIHSRVEFILNNI